MEWTPIIDCAYDCTITVGTIAATGPVTIQLKDFEGKNLTVKGAVDAYISSDVNGETTSTVTSIVILADGILHKIEDTKAYHLISESNGSITLTLNGTGANSRYLNVVLPNGKIVTSSIITFTS